MASLDLNLKVDSKKLVSTIERMVNWMDVAPDDDPAKVAMLAFGEIDPDLHITSKTSYEDGECTLIFGLSPELQCIADMVPGT